MKKILITGAGGPAGVNVAKSLMGAPEKFEIYGTDISQYHLHFAKNLLKGVFLVPRCNDAGYIDALNEIIDNNGIDYVHPQPDVEVAVISENREKLHAKTFLPEKETVKICQNKNRSAEIWDKNGFNTVKSIILRDDHLEEDLKTALNVFGGNIWIRATTGAGGRGSTPADSVDTGLHWIKYWRSRGKDWEFIAQENLTGKNIAFQSLWKNGELIVSQARERLEYIYPYLAPSGVTGTPTVAQTVNDDKINELATKAVKSIDQNASGIFCVDMKFDKEGKPMPTEINAGRYFTTSYFFSKAGKEYGIPYANMPYMEIKLAFDEE
ncbi:MAG: hypothetical protein ACTSU2_14620, partial [Promethearchaeota archaeon]